jgi:RNA polymerase sigma-70 factor (ECF subfamily)
LLEAAPSIRVAPHEIAPVSTVAPVGTVAEETRLLRRADESLRSGDAARALVLLDEHARTFPHGVLTEERSAERVLTLCKLGRKAQARAEATRFLRATPDSPLADSIRKSCGAFDDGGGR